jgi:hypothetical protein
MSDNRKGPIRPYTPGVFEGISNKVKLIARLMVDSRVNPLLKLIPFASGVYLIFPDLLPGPVDDAVLVWLSTYLFVELCPPEIVDEHERSINKVMSGKFEPDRPGEGDSFQDEDIIEGEILNEDKPKNPGE